MNKYKIYTLEDPITNEIRYVGKTSRNTDKRLSEHISSLKANHGTHKINWIKLLLKNNLKPLLKIIDLADNELHMEELEKYWIKQLKHWGFSLVNSCDYGPGVLNRKVHEETKIKVSIPLICWDKNGDIVDIFYGAREASRKLNISYKHISSVAKNKRSNVSGYRFKYYRNEFIIEDKIEPYCKVTKSRIIYQFNKNGLLLNTFSSVSKAAKEIDGNSSNIGAVANKNSKELSYKGFLWSYTNEPPIYNPRKNQHK